MLRLQNLSILHLKIGAVYNDSAKSDMIQKMKTSPILPKINFKQQNNLSKIYSNHSSYVMTFYKQSGDKCGIYGLQTEIILKDSIKRSSHRP